MTTNLSYDDESIVWQGRPSQWVNIGVFLFWSLFALCSLVFMFIWNYSMAQDYSDFIGSTVAITLWGIIGISLLNILVAYLTTRYELTVITKNKIKESKGITCFFQVDRFAEISDITDIQSPAAGLLSIWGLASITILTNDEDQPSIKIRAIRDRDHLIDKLLPIWRELKIERKGYFGQ